MPPFHSALAIILLPALLPLAVPPPAAAATAAAVSANEISSTAAAAANRPPPKIGVAVWRPGPAAGGKGGVRKGPLRRYLSCSCGDSGVCGCCAPVQAPQIGFDQNVCLNLTFVPTNLTVFLDVLVGDTPIVHTSLSGNNPPPLCLPVPQVPILALCVRLQDVRLESGPTVHACPALEAQVSRVPVIVVGFDCIRVNSQGVSVVPRRRSNLWSEMGVYAQVPSTRQHDGRGLVEWVE